MSVSESSESIIQNLKDAGCDSETIEKFMADLQKGKEASGLKRLAVHRKKTAGFPAQRAEMYRLP